jgi:hypothetical protein
MDMSVESGFVAFYHHKPNLQKKIMGFHLPAEGRTSNWRDYAETEEESAVFSQQFL